MPRIRRRAVVRLCLACAAGALFAAPASADGDAVLTRVDSVTSMTDVVAVRTDGLAVAQVGDSLRLVDVQGGTYPFAGAAMQSLTVEGRRPRIVALAPVVAGDRSCPFRPNDLVVGVPGNGGESLAALDAQGLVTTWVSSLDGGTALAASFDQAGRFGQTLLVLVDRADGGAIEEIDCRGQRVEVAGAIAGAQRGLAVLPTGAGGGLDGRAVVATATGLVTVTPAGEAAALAVDGWSATVQDPVTGLTVVPPGFVGGGGQVDLAGGGGLLRVSAADLGRAGLRDGDLLVATGSPAELVAVHCAGGGCAAKTVARGSEGGGAAAGRPAVVSGELGGNVVLPRDPQRAGWLAAVVGGGLLGALVVPGVIRLRRRRAATLELEERLLDDHPAQRRDQG
jgi:hypothetical protein